jgi:hypothetical protein
LKEEIKSMKNKNLIYGIIVVFVVAFFVIFVWNNYQIQIQERTNKPIKLPPIISSECGIEQCHGLDITCGSNVPDACTMMYMAGDNCRQFASCEIVAGQCKLIKSPKFDDCRACVEKCEQNNSEDPIKFFECESKCME